MVASDWSLIALVCFHPQRLMQYLASRNTLFNLNNFLDKAALQGEQTAGGCLGKKKTPDAAKPLTNNLSVTEAPGH